MIEQQPELFPDRINLIRVDPDKNMRRFYLLTVQRDLFGGAMLTREFGRIGSPGRVMKEMHCDEAKAIDALSDWISSKSKKGYERQ